MVCCAFSIVIVDTEGMGTLYNIYLANGFIKAFTASMAHVFDITQNMSISTATAIKSPTIFAARFFPPNQNDLRVQR